MKNNIQFKPGVEKLFILALFCFSANTSMAVCNANASFTVKDSAGYFYFTNLSTGANKYFWDFSDGTTSVVANPVHKIGSKVYYNVYLYALDSTVSGCVDTANVFIQVGCMATASFAANRVGAVVNFINYSVFTNKYYWDFGNGQTSTLKNPPSQTYIKGKIYYVKLLAWDTTRVNCTDTAIVPVDVPKCEARPNFSFSTINKTASLYNLSKNALNYKWDFGDGNTSNTSASQFIHNYANAGTYKVSLIAFDSGGTCSDTMSWSVKVNNCKAKAAFTPYYQTNWGEIYFPNGSGSVTSYYWTFGDGQTSRDKAPVHTYSAGGTYNVKLVALDSNLSGCSDSIVKSVYINPCRVVASGSGKDELDGVHFKNNSVYADVYKWHFDDWYISTSTAFEPIHSYSGPARNYNVLLVAIDTSYSGCVDSFYFSVAYKDCIASFDIEPDTSNQFSALVVEKSRTGTNTDYVWDFGDGDTSHSRTPSHIYAGTGPYVLCLTIYDSTCVSTYCDTLGFDSSGNILAMRPFSIRVTYPGENYNGQTSVEELEYSNIVKAFPNPAGNSVTVTSNAWNIEQVNLVDIQGKVILQEHTMNRSKEINLSSISPGLYFIEVVFENHKTGRIKLIKN